MGKSIRSKAMKRARTVLRKTIGEAQTQKNLRKSLRRLNNVVSAGLAAKEVADPEAAAALASVRAALSGGGAGAVHNTATGGLPVVQGLPAVPQTKKLRYTFNQSLRDTRLAADLEDLSDDEEAVFKGIVPKKTTVVGGAAGAGGMEEEDSDSSDDDGVELSGVKMGPGRRVPKRVDNGRGILERTEAHYEEGERDGCPGMYESDPRLANPKRQRSHRSSGKAHMKKSKFRAALAATTPGLPGKKGRW